MKDCASLSDADLNAAIAVRVCGWEHVGLLSDPDDDEIVPPVAFGCPPGQWDKFRKGEVNSTATDIPLYAIDLNATFAAQMSLAAKGTAYLLEYSNRLQLLVFKDSIPPGALFAELFSPARIRCIAMLMALDSIEGKA